MHDCPGIAGVGDVGPEGSESLGQAKNVSVKEKRTVAGRVARVTPQG